MISAVSRERAAAVADAIAVRLTAPAEVRGLPTQHGWWPQSLAHGAAGIALLHIARARAGLASWQVAHDWLACATSDGVRAGTDTHLYYGAPAVAFALHLADDDTGRYSPALDTLDQQIDHTTRRRLDAAHARMDRGELPALAEFDTIRGLSGVGAYLLRRDRHTDLVRAVLGYLVRLTALVRHDGDVLPGWWTLLGPGGTASEAFPGGHGNNGMAHGVGGPLALLALALRRGVTVDGQVEAIGRIRGWLDDHSLPGTGGLRWPYWVTRAELRTGIDAAVAPARPSWCYGTAGLARAQQLAALAIGDPAWQRRAEHALTTALTDPAQLAATNDRSLCHGDAGLLHVTRRAAEDAPGVQPAELLPRLLDRVAPGGDAARHASELLGPTSAGFGFLEGAAGVGLALHSAATDDTAVEGWDSCLLTN